MPVGSIKEVDDDNMSPKKVTTNIVQDEDDYDLNKDRTMLATIRN